MVALEQTDAYTGMRGILPREEWPEDVTVTIEPGAEGGDRVQETVRLPQTLDDYRHLWLRLQGLREKHEDTWRHLMRVYMVADHFFALNFVLTEGREARDYDGDGPFFFTDDHLEFSRTVQFSGEGKVIVASRGWGKSSWVTKCDNMMKGLADPNSSSCIFSTTKEYAQKHLLSIGQELDKNDLLRKIWRDRVWWGDRPASVPWSPGVGYCLRRTTNRREQTFECQPLIVRLPVGMHYDRHYVDDAEEETAVSSIDNMQKVSSRFTSAQNLVSVRSEHWYVGTYYHPNGLSRELEEERGYGVICYPCEDLTVEPEEGREGPAGGFVRGLDPRSLHDKYRKMGCAKKPRERKNYMMQVCMDPLAGEETRLSESWVRWFRGDVYDYAAENECCFVVCQDPSPGNNDATFTWVWMLDWRKRAIWVDGWRNRLQPKARIKKTFATLCSWENVGAGVEQVRIENFGQAEYVDRQDEYNHSRGKEFYLIACHDTGRRQTADFDGRDGGKREKEFLRWETPLRSGQVWFPADGIITEDDDGREYDLVDYFVKNELNEFPKPRTDDGLDAGSLLWLPRDKYGGIPWPEKPREERSAGRFNNRGRRLHASTLDLGIL